MKISFCGISSMKYYKGACDEDVPVNGGRFVAENGFGHEEFNFCHFEMDGCDSLECVGFVEWFLELGALGRCGTFRAC